MPYKERTRGNTIDIKKQKDTPFVGTYLETQNITTAIGPQKIYKFEGEDGQHFGIFGFTMLNLAMADVSVGTILRITYTGTQNVQTKFGKKDVHQVRVEEFEKDEKNPDDLPF
jgi:hypothetical protein